MAILSPLIYALNAGQVSPLAMARVDLARMRLTAEEYKNCIPRVLGPLRFRPGLAYIGATKSNGKCKMIPFIFAADDTAMIELTDQLLKVRIGDDFISRTAVSTTVTNGDFSSATGWTTTVTGTGVASISGGKLTMYTPGRGDTTLCKRSVTVAAGDQNVEHALRIVVDRGPVTFRCGSSNGGDEYIEETTLGTGTFSLAFTPTGGTFYVQFSVESEAQRIVDSITVDVSGDMEIAAPWLVADLPSLRYDQSGDVIFVTSSGGGYQPMRIERRAARSWGLVYYEFMDGPYVTGKTDEIKLTPSVYNGNGTLTSDKPFFKSSHVGTLFKLHHTSTHTSNVLSAGDEYTDTVRVTGLDQERDVTTTITGTWSGTIRRYYSDDDGETWTSKNNTTVNIANTDQFGGNNQILLARWGFLGGEYTSGTATVGMTYTGGGGSGICRVTKYNSATSVDIEVIERFHKIIATKDWYEGEFSSYRGWPTALTFFEGRLWFGGTYKIYGSVSDDFTSFDLETEGDSGPVIRSVATGPVNNVYWLMGLARLAIGTVGSETVGRSSSFDEPLTPSNFSLKDASTQGCADVAAVKLDRSGLFVQRSGKRLYELYYSIDTQDYTSADITRYAPDILDAGVTAIAVQRQPDTRIWVVLDDGTAAVLTFEKSEEVIAWSTFETDGIIEDVAVLPNADNDDVEFVVRRTINGTVRYRERLAYDTNAEGGDSNRMADSYKVATLAASTSVTGLSHLEGETVVAWADGSPVLENGAIKTFTVASGAITLPSVVTGDVVVGLQYTGRWKSTKLAYASQLGSALSQRKKVGPVYPILYKTHILGPRFGPDYTRADPIPRVIDGVTQAEDTLLDTYDSDSFAIPGRWSPDARLCMTFTAPFPTTVLGVGFVIGTNDKL